MAFIDNALNPEHKFIKFVKLIWLITMINMLLTTYKHIKNIC